MNARQRLDNLSRAMNAGGRCPACGADDSRRRTVVILPPKLARLRDGPPADPSPCATCGREPLIVEVVFKPARPGGME